MDKIIWQLSRQLWQLYFWQLSRQLLATNIQQAFKITSDNEIFFRQLLSFSQKLPHPPYRGGNLATFQFLVCWDRAPGGWVSGILKMILTVADIQNDIAEYQARISVAKSKLDMLPAGYLSYAQYKKREKQRREFEGEIEHVKNLIKYAQGALNERKIQHERAKGSQGAVSL